MRIGFYSNGSGWTFGELGANVPYCTKCRACHYETEECFSDEQRRNLAVYVKHEIVRMQSEGRLGIEYIFREAFGLPKTGLLRGFGKDKFEDLLAILQ